MILSVEHELNLKYDDFISESWIELRMQPRTSSHQTVHLYSLSVGPPAKVYQYDDWAGNRVRHFSIANYHQHIEVISRCIVETKPARIRLEQIQVAVTHNPPKETFDYLQLRGPVSNSKLLQQLHQQVLLNDSEPVGPYVARVSDFVHKNIAYTKNVTSYHSTIEDALEKRAGVCQDIAQIMIGLLRLSGIPARYINGYLHVPDLNGGHAESHAWLEFWTEQNGWVAIDPTGNVVPGEHHIVVAAGRDYDDVPPNKGVFRGVANEEMTASVRTKEVNAPEFGTYQEILTDIELPTYADIPSRVNVSVPDEQETVGSQQQQQQ